MAIRKQFLFTCVAIMFGASFALGSVLRGTQVVEAQSATRVFELRTYTTPEGKLDDLQARFRDHTIDLFERHGMTNIGYWTPQDTPSSSNTLIYIIAHNGRLQAYQPGSRKHFRGPATPENLRQWLGIPLSPKEVVNVLWAEVAASGEGAQVRAAWDGSGGGPGAYRLEVLMKGGSARRWWVDARTFLPIRFQALNPGGETILTVRYDAYRREADTLIPTDVSVEVGPEKRTLEVHYGRVSVNRGLAPPAFRLPAPANVPVIPMGR